MTNCIYDHPLYYDVLFSWDRTPEADFYEAVFRSCDVEPNDRILEVACGSGQVARHLARRGWTVTGLDSRSAMLDFMIREAKAEGVPIEARQGDMAGECGGQSEFAGAYNPLSSFRLLHDDDSAGAHLRSMAGALRAGAPYILDMAFLKDAGAEVITTEESWEMSRGTVHVRGENDAVYVDDDGVRTMIPWGEESHLRGYTSETFAELIRASGQFVVETIHPEAGRNAEGVSVFELDVRAALPVVGRALVVLRRA